MRTIELLKIRARVRKHFRFLFQSGFRFFSARLEEQHMGDWEVILRSTDLLIKIYKDRGEIMLSIGPRGAYEGMWYGLRVLVYFVSRGERLIGASRDYSSEEQQMERLSASLEEHMSDIRNVMIRYEYFRPELNTTYEKFLELSLEDYARSRSPDEFLKYVPRRRRPS